MVATKVLTAIVLILAMQYSYLLVIQTDNMGGVSLLNEDFIKQASDNKEDIRILKLQIKSLSSYKSFRKCSLKGLSQTFTKDNCTRKISFKVCKGACGLIKQNDRKFCSQCKMSSNDVELIRVRFDCNTVQGHSYFDVVSAKSCTCQIRPFLC